MQKECPICGQRGSIVRKWVLNQVGAKYWYYYTAHHDTGGITWHYLGKSISGQERETEKEKEASKRKRTERR